MEVGDSVFFRDEEGSPEGEIIALWGQFAWVLLNDMAAPITVLEDELEGLQ